jgi:hypothetical protein
MPWKALATGNTLEFKDLAIGEVFGCPADFDTYTYVKTSNTRALPYHDCVEYRTHFEHATAPVPGLGANRRAGPTCLVVRVKLVWKEP